MSDAPNNGLPSSPTGRKLRWTVHPVRRRPGVSLAVSAFVILVAVVVYYAMDSRIFAVLALVVMLMSLGKFYFPTSYVMDEKGVTIKSTTQTIKKEWKLFRSYYPDNNGVLLSPFPEPTRLENFRGVYLMTQGERHEILAFIKDHVGASTAAPETTDQEVSDESV